MPYAIEWIGRDSSGFCLMHKVVRGLPSLFGLAADDGLGKKRRRLLD